MRKGVSLTYHPCLSDVMSSPSLWPSPFLLPLSLSLAEPPCWVPRLHSHFCCPLHRYSDLQWLRRLMRMLMWTLREAKSPWRVPCTQRARQRSLSARGGLNGMIGSKERKGRMGERNVPYVDQRLATATTYAARSSRMHNRRPSG